MKKWFVVLFLGPLFPLPLAADNVSAVITQGPDGKYYPTAIPAPVTPIINSASSGPTVKQNPAPASATDTGSLINPPSPGYIYYTLPGGIQLVTPWSAAIAAEGWDFIGKESILQGYVPLAQWWKIKGVLGGGINAKGEGSPMGGGILTLAQASLGPAADFNLALTGGYNLNARHALAVVSGSIYFLK